MTTFTLEEQDAVRRGVLAAASLVSVSDPGFIDGIRESLSISGALADAPDEMKQLMAGGFIMPPQARTKAELMDQLLGQAHAAIALGDAKDAATAQSIRALIRSVCQHVAEAAKGISPAEQDAINQIMAVAQGEPTSVPAPAAPAETSFQQPPAANTGAPTMPTTG